jgi:hypothetical protein
MPGAVHSVHGKNEAVCLVDQYIREEIKIMLNYAKSERRKEDLQYKLYFVFIPYTVTKAKGKREARSRSSNAAPSSRFIQFSFLPIIAT